MKKVLLAIILSLMLLVPAGASARTYSATFDMTGPEAVINTLKQETGLEFMYQKGILADVPQHISGSFQNLTLDQLLNRVVNGQLHLAYKIVDKTVVISRPMATDVIKGTISGVVYDREEAQPLPGVSVVIEGTPYVTVTDVDGRFVFTKVSAVNPVITVSFIGMNTESMAVNQKNRNSIRFEMMPSATMMEDVIVTGYQTISKERAAGSFSVVTPEKLQGKLQTSILDRMEGMVAGMNTRANSIRGVSTLNGTKTPLYVVDGIPYEGSIAAINPSEIENVTVLKDASAASIYGARSANGVIVITTRSGQAGRTKVSYNGSLKITPLPDRDYMNLTSVSELVDLQETLFQYPHSAWNSKTANTPYNEVYTVLYDHENGYITDEEKEQKLNYYRNLDNRSQVKEHVRRASLVQQHNISFSGGSGIYRYAISANYLKNYPYEKIQSNDRFGFNLKNTFDFFKWFRVNLGIIQSNTNADYDNGFSYYGYLNGGAPYKMLYNEDGTPAQWYSGKNQREIDRLISVGCLDESYYPVLEQDKAHYKSTSKYQNINLNLHFTILEGLSLDLMYQSENTNSYTKQYYSENAHTIKSTINNATVIEDDGSFTYHIPKGGQLRETWGKSKSYTARAQINFNRSFASIHDVQAIVGAERRQVTSDGTSVNKWGYDDQTLAFKSINELNLGQPVRGTQSTSGSYYYSGPYDSFTSTENRYVSFYGNASYTFDRLITATGSIRLDKSNLFGTDPKWQNRPLWSVGLQYNALRGWNWIDRLSVRGTYGINGNVARNSGPYMIAQTSSRPNSYTNDFYMTITTPPNPALRWEKTKVLNLGVDFSVLNNRLNGSIEYYSKNTDDLLGNRLTDATCGWSSLQLNYGSMYNRGVEISLNSVNIANRDFTWASNFVFSYNKNKLTKIENSGTSAIDYFYSMQNREGHPMNSFFTIRYAGLNSEGYPTAYKADGTITDSYRDLTAEDLVYSGTATPPYTAALTNKLSYKGFDLEFMFVFYGGHKLRDVAAGYVWNRMATLNYASVMDRDRMHFWQKPGDENDPDMAPRFLYRSSNSNAEYLWSAADKHIEKGDYIKLRNVIIGYTFPKKWIRKAFLQNLRIDLQIQNLWYWAANKRNLDPEVWSGTSLSPSRGSHIPATYTIGLQANF